MSDGTFAGGPPPCWPGPAAPRQDGGAGHQGATTTVSRKICAALASALAALALGGCYQVTAEDAVQQDVIGDTVRATATFALDGAAAGRLPGQFVAAFLVPDGATAPATLDAKLPGAPAAVAMTRRPSLDESLQGSRPAPAGRRWVGYATAVVGLPDAVKDAADVDGLLRSARDTAPPAQDDAGWSVAGDFTIARGDGGLPLPAAFEHAAMGGFRIALPAAVLADGEVPGDVRAFALGLSDQRPFDCDEVRAFPFPELFGAAAPAVLRTTACGPTSAGGALALADLRGSGASVEAAPGATVTVPFTLRSVGPAGPVYALRAQTTLPGATATPAVATLAPSGPGFHDVAVTVTVPVGAEPGDRAVSLVATAGGEEREALGQVTVRVPAGRDRGAPGLQGILGITIHQEAERLLRFSPFTAAVPGRGGRVAVGNVWCLRERGVCDVRVRITAGGVALGSARLRVPAQARRRVALRTGRRARALLRLGSSIDAVVTVRRAADPEAIVEHVQLRRRR